MPWYPDAIQRQLTAPRRAQPNEPIRMPTPHRINLHTAVSNSTSLAWTVDSAGKRRDGFFNTPGAKGVFSHFYIRADGRVEQMQSTDYRSTCDLDGSPDTISIESWDGAKMQPWTPVQLAALVGLIRWIWDTHPTIPRKLAVDNHKGPTSWGLSWHQLGVPYDKRRGYAQYTPAEGGLYYTTARGKECPGPPRIAQITGLFAAATGSTPAPEPSPEEDIMASIDELRTLLREEIGTAAWSAAWGSGATRETAADRLARAATHPNPWAATFGAPGETAGKRLAVAAAGVVALQGQVSALTEALLQTSTGGTIDMAAVEAAARRGVEQALGDLELTATITTDKA